MFEKVIGSPSKKKKKARAWDQKIHCNEKDRKITRWSLNGKKKRRQYLKWIMSPVDCEKNPKVYVMNSKLNCWIIQ